MLPTLQRKFLFRKLLQPFKEDEQQLSSGDSERGTDSYVQLASTLGPRTFPGAPTVHSSMKMSACVENVGPNAF